MKGFIAADIMTRRVLVTTDAAPVEDAAELMARHGVGALPVLGSRSKLVGILTMSDLKRHRISAEWTPPTSVTRAPRLRWTKRSRAVVREVMTSSVVTTSPNDPLEDVAYRLASLGVGCSPVVENGNVVGMISLKGTLQMIRGSTPSVVHNVRGALRECGVVKAGNRLKVAVSGHVVTLSGTVSTQLDADAATALALAIDGVAQVVDSVRVRPAVAVRA